MSAEHVAASAFIRSATAAAGRLRQGMAAAHGGLMSVADAASLRAAVEELKRLRIEGEHLAADLDCPELTAWVDEMREAEAGPREMVTSMRPVPAD